MEGSISARAQHGARAAEYRNVVAGVALAASVSIVAVLLAPHMPKALPLPAMVIALVLAISLHSLSRNELFKPGLTFCAKPLLRWAVALLGMRVAFGDIIDLGVPVALMVVVSMAATIVTGLVLAKALGQNVFFGMLVGSATAVCGASAALATSTVLPNYQNRDADVAFVVVGVNLLATLAMLFYPPLCMILGFDDKTTGIMLGATIHDVAQVVGSGYAVSDTAGNAAAIVKLFRVFLLLPVVLILGFYVSRLGSARSEARVAMPTFAIVFLVLCIVNSICSSIPAIAGGYQVIKSATVELSTWGLLLAISAIGLNTSIKAMADLGWRHIVNLLGTTLVILTVMTLGLAYIH
ncbi:putative sulfate exporter family transporter [Hyphomicrobium methylovorum]|uniref:YeiH family protein n=1 Tax=Hyphomicrobium methylovorum TaxID=84 RepID=UPI0015E7487D|nr:putative sulfate exporter family transporter [Hyphomicrobium methylovorum]MBA2125606.1 putative sulfate exporter family transporter [Hyphomicrobium methylovorum]